MLESVTPRSGSSETYIETSTEVHIFVREITVVPTNFPLTVGIVFLHTRGELAVQPEVRELIHRQRNQSIHLQVVRNEGLIANRVIAGRLSVWAWVSR